jgi:protein phosphatase
VDTDTTLASDTGPATGPAPWRLLLRSGRASATGNRRRRNEDASGAADRVAVVADGMGGHAAGEVAASIAVASVLHELRTADRRAIAGIDPIHAAVAAANDAIRAEARRAGTAGMGATLVGAAVVRAGGSERAHETVAVFHVGDSRCYRLHDGVLRLVTRDHSLVQQLVDAGRLAATDAAAHPMANVVTRALGPDPVVATDVALLGAAPGRLLLCSDGLSDEIPARTIGRVLAGIADPQAAAERLVELVLAGAARDNVTALVVDTVRCAAGRTVLDTIARLDHDGAARPSTPCCA